MRQVLRVALATVVVYTTTTFAVVAGSLSRQCPITNASTRWEVDPKNGCEGCEMYEIIHHFSDDEDQARGADDSDKCLFKIIVDLHVDDSEIFSGGPCPGRSKNKETKNNLMCPDYSLGASEIVPLIWALSTEAGYGETYLSFPISPLSLYSMTTLNRRFKAAKTHLQVRQNNCCFRQPNEAQRANAMGQLILKYFKQKEGKQIEDKKLMLWFRKPQSPQEPNHILARLPINGRNNIEYVSCAQYIANLSNENIRNYTCDGIVDGEFEGCVMSNTIAYQIGAVLFNMFLFICVLFVAPLPPLKICSSLLSQLSKYIRRHHQPLRRYCLARTESELRESSQTTISIQYRAKWGKQCSIFTSYQLVGLMPSHLLSSRVWPLLGAILSNAALNVYFFLVFLAVYIAWPLVQYYFIMQRSDIVDPAELTGAGCDWHSNSSCPNSTSKQYYHYTLVLASLELFLPPTFILVYMVVEWLDHRKVVFTDEVLMSRRRKELRCSTSCKLAEGVLKLHAWSRMTLLLQDHFKEVFATAFVSLPLRVVHTVRAVFSRMSPLLGNVLGVLVTASIVPIVVLTAILCHLIMIAYCHISLAYKLSLLALQSIPLLRLSTLIIYGSVWPLFDLEGSFVVLLLSVAGAYPLTYALNSLFQDVFMYLFFTSLGLLSNYITEVIFLVSILSTIIIRLRRQHRNFYEPFLSLQREIVQYCQKSELTQLENTFTRLVSPVLTCHNTTSSVGNTDADPIGSVMPEQGMPQNNDILRVVATQTFMVLSYEEICHFYPQVHSVLEKEPWSWCSTVVDHLQKLCSKTQGWLTLSRRQRGRRNWRPAPVIRCRKVSTSRNAASLYKVSTLYPTQPELLSISHSPASEPLLPTSENIEVSGELLTQTEVTISSSQLSQGSGENMQSTSSLNGVSCQCITWKEMERALAQHIQEKTISSISYAVLQAIILVCIFCFLLEFGTLFKSQSNLLRMISLAIPLADYIWHSGQLGPSFTLKIKVARKFNQLFQQERRRLQKETNSQP